MKKVIKRVVSVTVVLAICLIVGLVNRTVETKADSTNDTDYTQSRRSSLSVDKDSKLQIERNQLSDTAMGQDGTWTIFVYMCGSDLESSGGCASTDIKEMISANENENVNIVIQTGGSFSWNKQTIKSDKIGRYVIKNNKLELVENHPDASMGDYKTLKSFLNWGIKKYPAKNMGVVFWNHGGGPLEGVCYNEKYDYDALSLAEIELALECVSNKMTSKFEMIGFDACLMSTMEVTHVLVPYAKYMVASQQSEPADGWEYKSVVNALVQNPNITGDNLGKAIVDGFMKSIEENDDAEDEYATLSVIDLSKVDDLLVAFNDVAREMDEKAINGQILKEFTDIAYDSIDVGSGDYEFGLVDLYDYMDRVSHLINHTEAVKNAITQMTIYEKHGKDSANGHGVNFYYPVMECGFINLLKLRNVLTSPYYANYIDKMEHYYTFVYNDKIAQGYDDDYAAMFDEHYYDDYVESQYNLEDYVDNTWENNSYYNEKTFDFMRYTVETIDDYNKFKEEDYYKNVLFDDRWLSMYYE